jgi:hypothetical protein
MRQFNGLMERRKVRDRLDKRTDLSLGLTDLGPVSVFAGADNEAEQQQQRMPFI